MLTTTQEHPQLRLVYPNCSRLSLRMKLLLACLAQVLGGGGGLVAVVAEVVAEVVAVALTAVLFFIK